jgi:di/tricarboxylate transporter
MPGDDPAAGYLLFIWGRLPYDLVALLSLVAGVALGLVPASKAFDGWSRVMRRPAGRTIGGVSCRGMILLRGIEPP